MSVVDENREWFDRVSETYEKRWYGGNKYKEKWVEEYIRELEKFRGLKILDVGCGSGLQAQAMNAWGVDNSEGMLKMARTKGVKTYQAKSSELPFENETFDLLTSFNLMEHLPQEDRQPTVNEFHRVLKNQGWVLIETNNIVSPVFGGRPQDYIRTSGNPSGDYGYRSEGDDYKIYTHLFGKGEIEKMLETAGFRLESVRGLGFTGYMTTWLELEKFPVEKVFDLDRAIGMLTWLNPRIRYMAVK